VAAVKSLRNESDQGTEANLDSPTLEAEMEERFRIYRLCECETCEGIGTRPTSQGATSRIRCPECRGEGKVRQLVATAPTPQAVGVALVQLGREGEFADCPVGLLDTLGEKGQKWLINPWLPSARNVKEAARVLAKSKGRK